MDWKTLFSLKKIEDMSSVKKGAILGGIWGLLSVMIPNLSVVFSPVDLTIYVLLITSVFGGALFGALLGYLYKLYKKFTIGDLTEDEKGFFKLKSKNRYHYGGVLVAVLFLLFIYPGPFSYMFWSGMGSIKPGCKMCRGQPIYCAEDRDCPTTVDEVFYGELVTLASPKCEAGWCGYHTAVDFPNGAVACNFLECVYLPCVDECEWQGCSGDYRCYDLDGDLCDETVWDDDCNLPYPKHEGLQGHIREVKVLSGNNVLAGNPITIQVVFEADMEGYYMLGAGIVYPEKPLYMLLPKEIRRNYCDPSKYWYGKEILHLYEGVYPINFTIYTKANTVGQFYVDGVWLRDCSNIIDSTGYDYSTVRQFVPINVYEGGKTAYRSY